jgi:hypothetical protein
MYASPKVGALNNWFDWGLQFLIVHLQSDLEAEEELEIGNEKRFHCV